MSEVKPLTEREREALRFAITATAQKHGISYEEAIEAAFIGASQAAQASRAREAKLVEALEFVRTYAGDTLSGPKDGLPDDKTWHRSAVAVIGRKVAAALAPYTLAEMPSDVHPQEG